MIGTGVPRQASRWRRSLGRLVGCLATIGLTGSSLRAQRAEPGVARAVGTDSRARSYLLFVTSASRDLVTLVRFSPAGGQIEHRTPVELEPGGGTGGRGDFATGGGKHLEGGAAPGAVAVAPDGIDYYVVTGHGFPHGELVRFRIAADSNRRIRQPPDTATGQEPVGWSPGAIDIDASGTLAWVADAGRGTPGFPGAISVVYLDRMAEAARIQTCEGARGSHLTTVGTRHYSVCGDTLVEIDVTTMRVARRLVLTDSISSAPCAARDAVPTPDGATVFVACSGSDAIVNVAAESGTVRRRIAVGHGVSRLAITHDGRTLVAANRGARSVSLVSTATGAELARIPTRAAEPCALAVSDDDRFAFVSEAGDSLHGAVERIDLATHKIVDGIAVAPDAWGVAFWKSEPLLRPQARDGAAPPL